MKRYAEFSHYPKCAYGNIATKYDAENYNPPVLVRECLKCGYTWTKDPFNEGE